MRGLTEAPYRNAFSRYFSGIDLAIGPFITTVKGDSIPTRHIKDVLPENNPAMPVIPQLLSKDADGFICLAMRLYDLGYDEINWNLGCPYPMVAKKMRGSGLLPYPEQINIFLDTVLSKIPNRLSIKTRLGRFHEDEILSVLPVLNQYSLSLIIIHPRTGKQMYEGAPHLERFNDCLSLSKHPVVYNGDITSLSTFQMLASRFPMTVGWMIGRGLLSNPFLAETIKKGEIQMDLLKFKHFHDTLYEQYQINLNGPGHVLGKMKGHWQYISQGLEKGRKLLKKIQRTSNLKQYESIVSGAFQ
ncbi:MAG: tRNA-dihydrouridine synthase family protein [Candidatus Magnetomorum sp.]|nr:tRNA-dihydrouridine synthase family protein [Candidatus Magnetomorum sp.]